MSNFPNVFKSLRIKNGLTQQQTANKLALSRSTIGMYESGEREPSFEILENIADLFDVDMNYLLGKKVNTVGTNQFAKMLKYYLNSNNKTQKDLVDDLGFDKSTVSSWCSGNRVPKIDVIIDIAKYLHANVGDLIEDNRNDETYYLNPEARDMAQFLFENPEYKVLFDASRKVKPEDIQFVKEMINRMSNQNG